MKGYRQDNGYGSIMKVKGRDLYRIQIWLNVDGTRKRHNVYGKTRSEVRTKVQTLKREVEAGLVSTKPETVAEYLDRWYTNDSKLAPKTIHSRLVNINRMSPFIGGIKLRELRAPHISRMYKGLSESLSDHSVKQVHANLRKALKDAVKDGTLLNNPIDRLISTPTARRKEMETLTSEERERLLALNDEWTPLFTILSLTGLRVGEALGLSWSSIVNMDKGDEAELMVKRTLGRVPLAPAGQRLDFKEPKTEMSRRTTPLTTRLVTALKVQKVQAREGRDDLVFPDEKGGRMEPTRVNRALKRSLKKAGIEKHIRVHDLRHTAGSIMHQNGVSAKEIQRILGHSNIQTTLDIYVHTNKQLLRDAMERGEAADMPSKAIGD